MALRLCPWPISAVGSALRLRKAVAMQDSITHHHPRLATRSGSAGTRRSRAASVADTLGFVCLAVALVLALPGVRAVRADGDATTPPAAAAPVTEGATTAAVTAPDAAPAAPACEVEPATAPKHVHVPRPPTARDASANTVVLNTSGYNYR